MDKQKVNTKFSIGRKGNSSSSHYRIKSGEVNIQLMAVIAGNKPSEQTEFLLCKLPHRHVFIAAYLKGNGYVKLFTLRNYIQWEHHDCPPQSVDITHDEYNNDIALEKVLVRNF